MIEIFSVRSYIILTMNMRHAKSQEYRPYAKTSIGVLVYYNLGGREFFGRTDAGRKRR